MCIMGPLKLYLSQRYSGPTWGSETFLGENYFDMPEIADQKLNFW